MPFREDGQRIRIELMLRVLRSYAHNRQIQSSRATGSRTSREPWLDTREGMVDVEHCSGHVLRHEPFHLRYR